MKIEKILDEIKEENPTVDIVIITNMLRNNQLHLNVIKNYFKEVIKDEKITFKNGSITITEDKAILEYNGEIFERGEWNFTMVK